MIETGLLLHRLSVDSSKITASVQATLVSVKTTADNLQATITDINRTIQSVDGVVHIVRVDLKEEHDTLVATNRETLQAMNDLDTLVKNLDISQKEVVVSTNQVLRAVQGSTEAVSPVLQQTQKDLADLEPVIAQTQVLMKNSSDTMGNVSASTADIAHEIHKYVYPPTQKWYQKIWGPLKLALHMITVPI
jgi:uncharacterized membrane protein